MQVDPKSAVAAVHGEDRRNLHRRRLLKPATISPDGLDTVFDCVLRNVSESGARVRVESHIGIPNSFKFMSHDPDIETSASVVWRSKSEMGLQFLKG